ncbi:amino acid ABC transporter ATP-binding protein [Pseudomonas sp. ADAK13]|uniref:amino acid ABC transporter ATP-binding protein n=1 Tax=Pseudomonas sp. ADAK13 TaxID=2730847 RepID=UPI0014646579|nr:amino acid ABC transporter ATP-binding protein [Pseudomonas sp. ADAK13]QJI37941.1 amino acid ABC transporter ATP-binding protein [Pseudomonas sp. ADAK13]
MSGRISENSFAKPTLVVSQGGWNTGDVDEKRPSLVSFDGVRKNFGSLQVLKDVTLDIKAGQVISLIGRSGSGKSTALRCVNGLERIDGGTLKVCGRDLSTPGSDLRELRKEVGIVFQSFNLFPHLTVADNVTLALRKVLKVSQHHALDVARDVLNQVGLLEKIDNYPEQLSGGQQQRVAIARALAMRPRLILFDEVTSSLDPELTGEVLKVIEKLAADGMTMLLVTHEMAFARSVSDEIVFMHQGKVWEKGGAQILTSPDSQELAQFIGSGL